MASQGVAATSRLAQMQMKFQQKQMQEREQRRIEMTGERSSDSSETSVPSKPFGNGKVRQMFDERRRGAGIDRSNPLKPITDTAKSKKAPSRSNAAAPIRRSEGGMTNSQANGRRNLGRSSTFEKDITGNSNRVYREVDSECETFSKSFSSLSLADHRTAPSDRSYNNHVNPRGDLPRGQSSNSIKLKPVLTKKSPLASSTRILNSSSSPPVSASRAHTQRNETDSSSTPRKLQTSTGKTLQKSSVRMTSYNKMVERQPPHTGPPPAGMATCRICGRNFNEDRLAKHEQVCLKMANSKRKIFDASKARVKGTEAEKYLKKPIRSSTTSKPTLTYTSSTAATVPTLNMGLKKNNWRKKHEEFIAAIRAAKQVQVHLAKGGNLKDLPPPPPSENPDYIQCPHCSRRFNQAAAERHIPKCATMLHNKPRAGATNKRKP